MSTADEPVKFTISHDTEPLCGEMIDRALAMADVSLARAAREMDGRVTMTFAPNAITFEYKPTDKPSQ